MADGLFILLFLKYKNINTTLEIFGSGLRTNKFIIKSGQWIKEPKIYDSDIDIELRLDNNLAEKIPLGTDIGIPGTLGI